MSLSAAMLTHEDQMDAAMVSAAVANEKLFRGFINIRITAFEIGWR
jgi:hypothetical protein